MQKVILIILDGWGVAPPNPGNAPSMANTPIIKFIEEHYPATTLHAAGINVGLPWWQEGNSEVGHLTIGTGKVIYQYLPRIINEIQNGYFFQNKAFLTARDHVKKFNSRLHLMGLVSSGAIHSYIDILYALLEFCQREQIQKVYLHVFTDGRDTPQKEAEKFLTNLKERLALQGIGKIATIAGRSFAMDRDQNWERIEKTYNTLIGNKEVIEKLDLINYIKSCYLRDITDEYIEPAVLDPEGIIRDNDAVVFFNFREERARELTQAFVEENFDKFPRKKIENLCFVTITRYLESPNIHVAYEPPIIENPLSKIISDNGFSQLKIAETEKFAHVTYFFNGLRKEPFPKEDRILIQSSGGPYYNQNPQMKAPEITSRATNEIQKGIYDFILINFANPDMVGHTADIQASIKAAEVVDSCVGEILRYAEGRYITLITADHGNFEEMLSPKGEPIGEHTSNPVPFYLVDPRFKSEFSQPKELYKLQKPGGFLFDIAPTILEYLNLPPSSDMIGNSLISSLAQQK